MSHETVAPVQKTPICCDDCPNKIWKKKNQQLNAILDQHDINLDAVRASGLALVIVGAVFTVGVVIFQIWTIIVANKARKEIDEGIKI